MGFIVLQRGTGAKPADRTKPLDRHDLAALFEADFKAMTEALVHSAASA